MPGRGPIGWPPDRSTEVGVALAGGATAGVGDQVVTRQNNRRLSTGRRWVRNGDQWTVTATDRAGTMTLRRANGMGQVVLPADYVSEHVELAYASTAHRAQGRTVDTAHAMVSATTTREVLYVSATRGREANRLYVDTHYDPDPQTSHGDVGDPMTAKEVLVGVLRNEGADVAAHEMIRRAQHEAEGMERLSAEYLTLATVGPSRALGRLARPLRADRCRAGICSGQRGARSAAGVTARGRSPWPRCRGGLPPTGRPALPGRRRRRGGGAARPGGPLGPSGRWPAANGRAISSSG